MRNTLTIVGLVITLLFSCVNPRKAIYFNNVKDATVFNTVGPFEEVIQENDLLSIAISSLNPDASAIFNMPNITQVESSTAKGNLVRPAGYLVDPDGNIKFPIIGVIKAAGLTKQQLQEYIITALAARKLLAEPVVDIRFLNYKVTVLGEVAQPTVINVPSEKITLLEALGLAGDITIYGKRSNILVIREGERAGEKIAKRVNLNSSDFLTSPYYYLKSNDVVYVEPNKARMASATRLNLFLPAIISGLSATVIIFDRLGR